MPLSYAVLDHLSVDYPPLVGWLHTRYSPVRRSPAEHCCSPLPLDLHVLSLSLAFILSQDQTLHCLNCFFPFAQASVSIPLLCLFLTVVIPQYLYYFSSCLCKSFKDRFLFAPPFSGTRVQMYTPFPSSPNFFPSFLQLFYAEGHISLFLRRVMGKDFFHASLRALLRMGFYSA